MLSGVSILLAFRELVNTQGVKFTRTSDTTFFGISLQDQVFWYNADALVVTDDRWWRRTTVLCS